MRKITLTILMIVFISVNLLLAKEKMYLANKSINIGTDAEEVVIDNIPIPPVRVDREEIILHFEDFEGDINWTGEDGWELTEADYYSPTHSYNSPNTSATMGNVWDLISPVYTLPEIGGEDVIRFGFFLNANMPDGDGDGDNFLEDYYSIAVADLGAIPWHVSDFNAYSGNSYWCGDEEIGGYADGWLQFLDSPTITIPGSGYSLKAMMRWGIEDYTGASVPGTCTDGWDAANVRISTDGGETWDILNGSDPYDFTCGYGWMWNGDGTETEGLPGWGGQASWHEVSFSLNAYAGQDVIVRFAFGSDPAVSGLDDPSLIGLFLDEIRIENSSGNQVFFDDADSEPLMSPTGGLAWIEQFYDYGDETRPGGLGWTEYLPGFPFNGNAFLDISDFAGSDIIFRFRSRYDDNNDGGMGDGLFIDDFKIYLESTVAYAPPTGLDGEALDGQCNLWWDDMNASGTDDFIYDNDQVTDAIYLTEPGTAYAGETFNLVGTSMVNSVSVYNINSTNVESQIAAFGTIGMFFNTEPLYEVNVSLTPGWNTFYLTGWDFNGSYIIATTFTDVIQVGLDITAAPSEHSVVLLGGSWDTWAEVAAGSPSLSDGEWGIRANISYAGANVSYNVYRDDIQIASGLANNAYSDMNVENNITYNYTVSATYSDGEESDPSASIELTPQSETVYEVAYDDGSSEIGFNAGQGNYLAVRFTSNGADELVRIKWYQVGEGGAFYLKMFEDESGLPGVETFSTIITGGVDGWNDKDMTGEGFVLSGDFWIGAKEFSSTRPFGLDTDSDAGNSYIRVGTTGDWETIGNIGMSGNLMFRASLNDLSGGTVSLDISHLSDWNLIGLPLTVEDQYYLSIFPDAIEGTCYAFGVGYELQDYLLAGEGYWLRFANTGTNTISGLSINNLTVTLNQDWNLITGISTPVDVNSIDDPNGLIIPGTVYGFGVGYEQAETLEPGNGYWVRSTAAGDVTIASGRSAKSNPFVNRLINSNTISFNGVPLYFGISVPEAEKLSYSLPPKPPAGAFDVRFAGDWKFAEGSGKIELQNDSDKLKITYDILDAAGDHQKWMLISDDGAEYELTGTGLIEVAGNVTGFSLNKVPEIPAEYTISQNYPNPFNPVTNISYELPEASFVTITVYNIMGRKVTDLVSDIRSAGYHQVTWNSKNLIGEPVSSGVYIYAITADNFRAVKKMILMK